MKFFQNENGEVFTLPDGSDTPANMNEISAVDANALQFDPAGFSSKASTLLDRLNRQLESTALDHGYDSISSATLRATYVGPLQEQAIAWSEWVAECVQVYEQKLEQIRAGQASVPSEEELRSLLPPLELPSESPDINDPQPETGV